MIDKSAALPVTAEAFVAHWPVRSRDLYWHCLCSQTFGSEPDLARHVYAEAAQARDGEVLQALRTALSTVCRCQQPVDGPHADHCPLNQYGFTAARNLIDRGVTK